MQKKQLQIYCVISLVLAFWIQAANQLKADPTSKPVDASVPARELRAQLTFSVDLAKCRMAGVTQKTLSATLESFFSDHAKFELSDLQNLRVDTVVEGRQVPLSDILKIGVNFSND